MNYFISKILSTGLLIGAGVIGFASTAFALPTDVTVTPPEGARFFVSQKFDLRVEGKGTGPCSATIKIDGIPRAFSSGTQNSSVTDGITSAGDRRVLSARAKGDRKSTRLNSSHT